MANEIKGTLTKRLPIFVDEDGCIFEKLTHKEGVHDPNAIRYFNEGDVEWYKLIGYTEDAADKKVGAAVCEEKEKFDKLLEESKVKVD